MGCAEEKVIAKLRRKKDIPFFCKYWNSYLGESGLLSFYDEKLNIEGEFNKVSNKYVFEIEGYPLFSQWAGGDQIQSFVMGFLKDNPDVELEIEYVATDDVGPDAVLDRYKFSNGILSSRRAYSEYGLGDYCEECDAEFDKYLIEKNPGNGVYKCPECGEIIEYSAQIEQTEHKLVNGEWQENNPITEPKNEDVSKQSTKKTNNKPKKEWTTNKLPDGTLRLKSYNGIETKVVIPALIGKATVSIIGTSAFSPVNLKRSDERSMARNSIKEIVVSEGITTIESDAFNGCSELQKVSLPGSITSIDGDAFRDCKKLENIRFESSANEDICIRLKRIGDSAFQGCESLKEIKLPQSLTSIADRAFYGCRNLECVDLPESLEELGAFAFYGTAYDGFKWPPSVKTISAKVYDGGGINDFSVPDGVELIESYAFHYWKDLSTITLPDSIKKIGSYAFKDCIALKEVSIPKGVQFIEEGTFSGCNMLEKVYIPASVTGIFGKESVSKGWREEMNPFWNCENITIYTSSGSAAEQYAKEYGIPVVILEA